MSEDQTLFTLDELLESTSVRRHIEVRGIPRGVNLDAYYGTIHGLLQSGDKFVPFSYKNPFGDSINSHLSLFRAALELGIEVLVGGDYLPKNSRLWANTIPPGILEAYRVNLNNVDSQNFILS